MLFMTVLLIRNYFVHGNATFLKHGHRLWIIREFGMGWAGRTKNLMVSWHGGQVRIFYCHSHKRK